MNKKIIYLLITMLIFSSTIFAEDKTSLMKNPRYKLSQKLAKDLSKAIWFCLIMQNSRNRLSYSVPTYLPYAKYAVARAAYATLKSTKMDRLDDDLDNMVLKSMTAKFSIQVLGSYEAGIEKSHFFMIGFGNIQGEEERWYLVRSTYFSINKMSGWQSDLKSLDPNMPEEDLNKFIDQTFTEWTK